MNSKQFSIGFVLFALFSNAFAGPIAAGICYAGKLPII